MRVLWPRPCTMPTCDPCHPFCTALTPYRHVLPVPRSPCPLAQQYVGVNVKKPLQRFQLMNEICYGKVRLWLLLQCFKTVVS